MIPRMSQEAVAAAMAALRGTGPAHRTVRAGHGEVVA